MGRKDWTEWLGSKCGLLTVLKIVPAREVKISSHNRTIFLCKCECGAKVYVTASEFARGKKQLAVKRNVVRNL